MLAAALSEQGPWPMTVLGLVMATVYGLIATGRMHKVTAALLGAIACTAIGLTTGVLQDYREIHAILGKDLAVLGVIVGTAILVDIASQSGLFQFLAIKIAKRAGGDPQRLYTALVALTVLFVSLLTIAPGTLIVVSLALVLCRTLELDARPYVLGIAIAANSGALVTLASGICTLMIGSAANLPYLHFFVVTTPMAFVTAIVAWWWIGRCYRAELRPSGDPAERRSRVQTFDEWAVVADRRVFFRSAWILGGTVVGFALAQQLGIGLDLVAMTGGAAAVFFSGRDPEEAIAKVNWPVILFFVGLFVIIGVVEHSGLLQIAAAGVQSATGGNVHVAVLFLVLFTLVTSAVMDNIPVAATMIPIVGTMAVALPQEPLWWSLVLSANLGGNGTPIGSISGVIALGALASAGGKKVGWGEWFRVGGPVVLLQLAVILGWLLLFVALDAFPSLPLRGS